MDIAFLETTQGRLSGQAVMHQDINAVSHVEQVAAETGDDFPVAIVGFQNKDGTAGRSRTGNRAEKRVLFYADSETEYTWSAIGA